MKTKKVNKKLTLRKTTITNFSKVALSKINGGAMPGTFADCDSIDDCKSNTIGFCSFLYPCDTCPFPGPC
jgi:hypothetical protein